MSESMSIREYAKSRSVNYESVRRQTKRYAKELKGHVKKNQNANMLDDYAISFLDGHRQERTIVLNPSDKDTEKELNRLKTELDHVKNELLARQQDIINLQRENTQLIQDKASTQLLLETNKLNSEHLEEEVQKLKADNTGLHEELNKYHKSLFGFYRKD